MTDHDDDTRLHELREKAKSLGIKQAANMKEETLLKRIAKAEESPIEVQSQKPKKPPQETGTQSLNVVVSEENKRYLDSIGLDFNWLGQIASQYGIDEFQYMHKFRAFRCYIEGKQVDWVSVNDLANLNGKQAICKIMLTHQPLPPERALIRFPWR